MVDVFGGGASTCDPNGFSVAVGFKKLELKLGKVESFFTGLSVVEGSSVLTGSNVAVGFR
jgi:hypothetical protein